MDFDNIIVCTAKDGTQNTFRYSVEQSDEEGKLKWVFRVMPDNKNAKDWYEFAVAIVDKNIGKVVMMNNRGMDEYKSKGISEKMIEESQNYLKVRIISSSNEPEHKSFPAEYRTLPATKIWEQLVEKGRAVYDEVKDVFTFIG